jgi:TatD DNase family protein
VTDLTTPPPAELVDSHAHLTDRRFATELHQILQNARASGVTQVITLATDAAESRQVLDLAGQHPGVHPGVGIHPNEVANATEDDWRAVMNLAAGPSVVAIGETGLDKHWDRTPFPLQQEFFERHLHLARELGRPIVIHARECLRELLDQLSRQSAPIQGVLHSFTGTWDEASEGLNLGLHISFAGMVTFQNASLDALRDVAARVPLDRLLVETDSPYLAPHPMRGRRNEPAHVAYTAARLAELRGLSIHDLARATTINARRLFALDARSRIAAMS